MFRKKNYLPSPKIEVESNKLVIIGKTVDEIPFSTIFRIEAFNLYDFLGNRIFLRLQTSNGDYFIGEGDVGFGNAQEALHSHFNFMSEFYETLDDDTTGNTKVVLYEKKEG